MTYQALSDVEALNYLASNHDLSGIFGPNTNQAKAHYEEWGFSEGRTVDNFDELGYLASHSDLMNVFGQNTNNLEINSLEHYINYGISENRQTTFDVMDYINLNNLGGQFSDDLEAAKRHYIFNYINEN